MIIFIPATLWERVAVIEAGVFGAIGKGVHIPQVGEDLEEPLAGILLIHIDLSQQIRVVLLRHLMQGNPWGEEACDGVLPRHLLEDHEEESDLQLGALLQQGIHNGGPLGFTLLQKPCHHCLHLLLEPIDIGDFIHLL